jgi:O-antigen/teichoic acid export membrane protein
MDSSTKRRLALGFLTNWVSKLAGTIVQLVQVPVFLHFWGVPLYGEWMIVTAIPSYLQISNFGFGSVAGNEMAMMTARGDREGALRVFQSCWWLITFICSAGIVLLGIVVYYLPASRYLKLHEMGETDTKWIIFYLGCAVLLSQLESLLQSAYRCIGRYSFGAFIKSMFSLAAFGVMLIPVCLGGGARVTALAFALANVFFTVVMCVMVRRAIPWIRFGSSRASVAEIRRLTNPAFAFMAFPIGNAFNLQGTLMAVGYALGPTSVVIFGTARTVSRVAFQIVQMVNNTFWPEMSAAFGTNDIPLIRALHRRCCQMALAISFLIVAAMMTLGPWFLNHWTGGHVPPSRGLLAILLVVVIANSLWSTSSTLLAAINRHQRLAAWYLFGTSITVVLTYLLAKYLGLYWAAASLLVSELVMNVYVLPASLHLSHDTFSEFLASMTHFPESLRPAALLARLRRTSAPGNGLNPPEETV